MPPQPPDDDLAALWRQVSDELRASFPGSTFDLWIEPLRAVGRHGSTVFVASPPAIRAWVERRYGPAIVRAIARRAPELNEVSFLDAGAPA